MMYSNCMVAVVACGGRILRERDVNGDSASVFLPFSSEYSIRLKNLQSRSALVRISIDGESVLGNHSNGLIIRPNSELELERFLERMDKGNRFKFIKKTQQIADHRGDRLDDGIIRIEWQYEEPNLYRVKRGRSILEGDSPTIIKGGGLGGSINAIAQAKLSDEIFTSGNPIHDGDAASTINATRSLNIDQLDGFHVDEGITVKGSISNQKFTYGYIGTLESQSHVITLKLHGTTSTLAEVSEPLTVQSKLMCSVCGDKNKSNANFCSNCGAALSPITR